MQLDATAFDIEPGGWIDDKNLGQCAFEAVAEVTMSVLALVFVAELAFERMPGQPQWSVVEPVQAMCQPDVDIKRQC